MRVVVGQLHKKLGDDAAAPRLIVTHFGLGYRWIAGTEDIAERTGLPSALVRSALASMVQARNANPRKATQVATDQIATTKDRLTAIKTEHGEAEVIESVDPTARRTRPEPLPTLEPPRQHGVSW